jgi:hypothetical protein
MLKSLAAHRFPRRLLVIHWARALAMTGFAHHFEAENETGLS